MENLITNYINNAIIIRCVDYEGRGGVVRMATMLLAGRSGVRNPCPKIFRPALEPTQPPIPWVPGVKRTRRKINLSAPISADVKNGWSYTSTPPI